ncbi:unnamed protein product [Symbiodinium sp. CCMP2592]|nr:unnamed protein product [Symbiodinium sp. CCMP2592]
MQVEQGEEVGSPTELAEESSDVDLEPKLEKRKREAEMKKKRRAARDRDRGKSGGSDQPLTARELRALLLDHRKDMTTAWQTFEDRLGRLEKLDKDRRGEVASVAGRTKVVEKDVMAVRKIAELNKSSVEACDKRVDKLAEEVQNLKVQLEENKTEPTGAAKDPWADYIRQQQQGRAPWPAPSMRHGSAPGMTPGKAPDNDAHKQVSMEGDFLSEEDRRTLIIGGWCQDTRRQVIEEESRALFDHPEIAPLLDVDKISVYGPRRSVGTVKFALREGERSLEEVKGRMWQVIKIAAKLKLAIASARTNGEDRTMWVSFVKTRTARTRSSHISMVRRVTIDLVGESKDDGGGVLNEMHLQQGAYDMDWNAGTIWCGIHKLASSTHRKPKDAETILMTGGWVNLDAIGLIAGCTAEAAKQVSPLTKGRIHLRILAIPTADSQRLHVGLDKRRVQDIGGEDSLPGTSVDKMSIKSILLGEILILFVCKKFHGWRAVGVGIAIDKLDSIVDKCATNRGIWVLARLRGLGRVVIGSMHCHTGATNAIYQAAVLQFIHDCPKKWRQYPAWCGIDANEQVSWSRDTDGRDTVVNASSNLNVLVNSLLDNDIQPIAPRPEQWNQPTHFPRDRRRRGRQIDAVWARRLPTTNTSIDPDRRHIIGTDHALLFCDVTGGKTSPCRWGNDSRARYMTQELPAEIIVDAEDLATLAKKCTKPRTSTAYRDPDEVTQAIAHARATHDPKAWKNVHRIRRQARRTWHSWRLSSILNGNWHEYRMLQREKKRRRGWWGELLRGRSSKDLTVKVQTHLQHKLVNEFAEDWDDILQQQIEVIQVRDDFVGFTLLELREVLHDMKVHSAVGPDGISVQFLRAAASDDFIAPQLLALVNHIVETCELPDGDLDGQLPGTPRQSDLRPICVSSAFHKMINKLICGRVMPHMRAGSLISGCGKGRQAADVIGTVSRVRDVTQEWHLPTLLCKLDISGAFDKIDRVKIMDMSYAISFASCQLRTYRLKGQVPGGDVINVDANVGIKQGAPESAEVFGLVMDDILSKLTAQRAWGELGRAFEDSDIELVFYQDDIFIVETILARLARKIKILERCLERDGLHLATEKTKIISSAYYSGPRRVQIGESSFEIAAPEDSVKVLGLSFSLRAKPSQQARELLGRTRDAAMVHKELLRGHASWSKKADMMRTLVESQFSWTAGAVHWTPEDLRQANMLQVHIMRSAFRIGRQRDERWHEWNARSMRHCRAWLASMNRERWSSVILRLQHTLAGHWARREEDIVGLPHPVPSLPMRACLWRNTAWWRQQQTLGPRTGKRHPRWVFIANVERQLADAHGVRWFELAKDRHCWSQNRTDFLRMWDVKWCQGRQLALTL